MVIRGTSQVLGVFGDPVAHSLSPAMHAQFAETTGANTVYVPFHVREGHLKTALSALPSLGIRGVNVTVPHKEAALDLVNTLEPAARAIGAVNTVTNDRDQLVGDNTDARGFLADLWASFPDQTWPQRPALVLGSGGAARAVIYALRQEGLPAIRVANRTQAKARALVGEMCPPMGESLDLSPSRLDTALADVGLIVNTTSLGMRGETLEALDLGRAPADAVVYDLIYNPAETPLLAAARARGLATANGLGMLVCQGAISYEIWTGLQPAVEPVIHALEKAKQT